MEREEKDLFFKLCSFRTAGREEVEALLKSAATPAVLGHLFFNRMSAVAYGFLRKNDLLGRVNREFRNSLQGAHEQSLQKNARFFEAVQYVTHVLEAQSGLYAMLKGAVLCGRYPEGYRTANDIDLLVSPETVTEIGTRLKEVGFRQGHLRDGVFIHADRKEIIASKMMRGETIPYIRQVDWPGLPYIEVDLNFSLDYKNSRPDSLRSMLGAREKMDGTAGDIWTLCREDFFIHLCGHLYKEATTLPWIAMHRDMTLYKYSDIYLLLDEMTPGEIDRLFARATELDMKDICCFAILQTDQLFERVNAVAVARASQELSDRPGFMDRVISPTDRKIYRYQESRVAKRFFAKDRTALLKEML